MGVGMEIGPISYFPGDQDTVNRKPAGTRDMHLQNTKRKLSELSVLRISYTQGSTVESILSELK